MQVNSGFLVAITALLSVLTGLTVAAVATLGYIAIHVNDLKSFVMTVISMLQNIRTAVEPKQKETP